MWLHEGDISSLSDKRPKCQVECQSLLFVQELYLRWHILRSWDDLPDHCSDIRLNPVMHCDRLCQRADRHVFVNDAWCCRALSTCFCRLFVNVLQTTATDQWKNLAMMYPSYWTAFPRHRLHWRIRLCIRYDLLFLVWTVMLSVITGELWQHSV